MKVIVTGGAGFIGSAVVRHLVHNTDADVLNIDKLTYAADLRTLGDVEGHRRYAFKKLDICDARGVSEIIAHYEPDAIMHLAAETHVDRSIDSPSAFLTTNILGTFTLLEASLDHWRRLDLPKKSTFRFHHVSTDEVFGALGPQGLFSEDTPYDPKSPYSASKASSDHLVRAWHHTYRLPTIISNCSNNYGIYQFPEKLIPLMIVHALDERSLPVYGRGENIRDWLFVDDHARALYQILTRGAPGESYNVSGKSERTNLEVVQKICALLDEIRPRSQGNSYRQLIEFVDDRPGHDFRYAIDSGKIERELGFRPSVDFETGLRRTVKWYVANESWWRPLIDRSCNGERLGLSRVGV